MTSPTATCRRFLLFSERIRDRYADEQRLVDGRIRSAELSRVQLAVLVASTALIFYDEPPRRWLTEALKWPVGR
jgi:hypothetical protein